MQLVITVQDIFKFVHLMSALLPGHEVVMVYIISCFDFLLLVESVLTNQPAAEHLLYFQNRKELLVLFTQEGYFSPQLSHVHLLR